MTQRFVYGFLLVAIFVLLVLAAGYAFRSGSTGSTSVGKSEDPAPPAEDMVSASADGKMETSSPTEPRRPAGDGPSTRSQAGPPPGMPKTAAELVRLRQYYDQTVWADEVLAQKYGSTIVQLWDRLIWQEDKYKVLRDISFEKLILRVEPSQTEIEGGVRVRRLGGPPRQIMPSDWPGMLSSFEQRGYQIIDTTWGHPAFEPPRGGRSAKSVVTVVMHVEHPATSRRLIVKANLNVDWASAPRREPMPGDRSQTVYRPARPGTVEATDVHIIDRPGPVPFREAMRPKEYERDATGRAFPSTIHPVLLHDLNDDGLPELVVGGYNLVYWNEGDWKFRPAPLCDHAARHPNAGLFADFTGDGVTDYLCGVKNGFPHLFEGKPGGTFPWPGKELNISAEKLRSPTGLAAGDIDQDGDLDVFIGQQKPAYQNGDIATPYYDANDSFPNYLLQNDGHGNFRDITAEAGLGHKSRRRNFCASFVDLDEDGDLDLMLTSDFAGTDLFYNDGHGHFADVTDMLEPRGYAFGMSHTFGDYNLDGNLDFLLIGMSSVAAQRLDSMKLFREGFDEYNEIRQHMAYGNRMYLREGAKFVQAPFNDSLARTGWTWGATTFDFDNDGDPDVYCTNGQISGRTTQDYYTRFWCHDVYYRRGERPDEAIRELVSSMAPLFSGNRISWGGHEHNALLMNRAGNDFLSVGFLMGASSKLDSRCTVSGDLDGDGRVDLIFEHKDHLRDRSILHFLRNEWPEANHWIGVHLRARAAGVSALGARVKVELAGGRTLLQHNVSGHGAWVNHANTVHFGLGPTNRVNRLEVRWPNGSVSELRDPAVDTYHVVSPVAVGD